MEIQLGYWRWKLFRWSDHPNPYRNSPDLALAWLTQFQSNSIIMQEFRDLLGPSLNGSYSSPDPQIVLKQIAEKLSTGEIQACAQPCGPVISNVMGSITEETEEDIAPLVKSKPAPAPDPEPAPEPESTLSPDCDPAATAQALKDAAEEGVPFCEECAKAAAALAAKPPGRAPASEPGDPFENPEASAKALKAAAEKGTPFCEECVKAAAAQANGSSAGNSDPEDETEDNE
jgi:hypothetical protein